MLAKTLQLLKSSLAPCIPAIFFFAKGVWAQPSQGESRAAIAQKEVISRAMHDLKDASNVAEIRLMISPSSIRTPPIIQSVGECITAQESDKRSLTFDFLRSNLEFSNEIDSADFSFKQRESIEFEMKNLDVVSFRINSRNIGLRRISGTVMLNGKESASFAADEFLLSELKDFSNLLVRRGSCADYSTQGRQ